jgi:hypothetical protein
MNGNGKRHAIIANAIEINVWGSTLIINKFFLSLRAMLDPKHLANGPNNDLCHHFTTTKTIFNPPIIVIGFAQPFWPSPSCNHCHDTLPNQRKMKKKYNAHL